VGTTVQVERGRWSYLDARLFVGGNAQAGITADEVKVAYKKYGAFSFNVKPLNGAINFLAVDADFGDTTLTINDSAIFPRSAGTLILDPTGIGAGPEIIEFTSNDIATGILAVPLGVQTAGAPAFGAGLPVQFSYATSLTFPVLAGATGAVVGDSSIFPPGFGRVRLYDDAGLSEIIELQANVTSSNAISFTSALVNPFSAGDKVELVEWYEVDTNSPGGYYSILFNPAELNTLDQFLYTIEEYAALAIEDFDRTVEVVVATSAPTESAPVVATCVIKDHLLDLSGAAVENEGVYARLLALPSLIVGVGVEDRIVSAKTDANGFFQFTLVQGATVDVIIPSTGYRRTIVVPSTTFANLFEIS
jgi:hypothetical protein